MADRMYHRQQMVDLVGHLVEDGCTREENREILAAAMAHIDGGGEVPYARGTCVNCGAVHVAWSEYQWAQLVRMPCQSCGKRLGDAKNHSQL